MGRTGAVCVRDARRVQVTPLSVASQQLERGSRRRAVAPSQAICFGIRCAWRDFPMELASDTPRWLIGAAWGLVAGSGLLLGAIGGYLTSLSHSAISRTMAIASGVLLSVVAVDLVGHARASAGLSWVVVSLLLGAATFSAVNVVLARYGAKHRKRCGECIEQPGEDETPGSGLAIAAGTFLDGVPEGAVLGISVLHQGVPASGVIQAFFLANIPEALSSSAGMRRAGRSAGYIFGLWLGIIGAIGMSAAVAGLLLRNLGPHWLGVSEAFAGGAILALVTETLIPEASHGSPQFVGVVLTVGFVILLMARGIGN